MGRPTISGHNLLFSGERARMFHEKIAPYVHPSMDYKLHPDLRGRFAWDAPQEGSSHRPCKPDEPGPAAMKVLRKYRKPTPPEQHRRPSQTPLRPSDRRQPHYLVDHVVVHNSPETQPGGRALKFYASQRLDIRRIETLKDGTEAVGNRVRVKVVKNKVAAPFRQAEFDIEFGKGISTSGCLLDLGIEHNVVGKSGSFFSYGDERLGQGRNNAKGYLDQHPRSRARSRPRSTRRSASARLVAPIDRDEPVAVPGVVEAA